MEAENFIENTADAEEVSIIQKPEAGFEAQDKLQSNNNQEKQTSARRRKIVIDSDEE